MINPKNLKKSILDYAIRGELSAKFRRENADNTTAFDEIAAYNAKTAKIKEQREKLLAKIDKQLKAEKGTKRKTNTRHSERSEESLNLNETRDSSPTAQNDGNVSGNLKTPEERNEQLKRLSGSLKAKIKSYRTITPLNQNAEFTPPFEIPNSWAWVKLGDLGEIITGSTPSTTKQEYYGNDYPFYKPSDLDNGYLIDKAESMVSNLGYQISRKLPKKSILVTCIGATIGKTAIINKEGICNQQINAIMPLKVFSAEYIYYFCISDYFQKEIIKNASATTLPILNKNRFENLQIPLPPLAEQRFIAEELEKALCECDKYESSVNALLNLEDGLFNKISKSVLDYAIHGELSAKYRRDLGISHGLAKSLIMSHGLDFAHAKSFKNNEIKSKETEMPLGISNPCDNSKNEENPCDIAPPTAFDEIAAYNAKITQMKGQRETLLLQIEKQHKSEKNAHRKARLKTLSGSLKAKIKSYRTITPLNQNAEFTPPFEIPNSWAWVDLESVCKYITAGGDKPAEFSKIKTDKFQIPIYTNAITENGLYGYTDKPTITSNETITVSGRGTIGFPVIRKESYVPIIRLIVVCPNPNLIDTNFLKNVILFFEPKSEGTSIPQLTVPSLKKQIKIPLPPLAEQRFIAEKLEKLLDLCKKLKTKP